MNLSPQTTVEQDQRLAEIQRLRQQVAQLQQTNHDLQIALETTAAHGDLIEEQLQQLNQQLQSALSAYYQKQAALQSILKQVAQQKADLEAILHTTIEHGDAVENQLHLLNQKLESEVQERHRIETRMQDLIQVISKEKSDLEIIMSTIIEHGDAVGEQWYNKALDATLLANIDSLTQVANRRRLDDYLADEWQKMAQKQHSLSFVLCDIDNFKAYNDSYTHVAGDQVLKQVASVLAHVIHHSEDLVARYGGEEFAIVLPQTNAEEAMQIAEMIRFEVEQLKIPHLHSSVSQYISLSIGVSSIIPNQNLTFSHLVTKADEALYEAKANGKNCIVFKPC
jgi:diguanylate cyclase (GGDEF)-like protein